MTYRKAQDNSQLATPAHEAIPWVAKLNRGGSICIVEQKVWHEANKEAMKILGCGPGELTVRQMTEDEIALLKKFAKRKK